MAEMKSLNGYEVVDAKAREDIQDVEGSVSIALSHSLVKVLNEYGSIEGDPKGRLNISGATYFGGIYDTYVLAEELHTNGIEVKVPRIEVKTQEEYNALETKDETMIYIIKE